MNHKASWNWWACGKHPVGGDYFRLGPNDGFAQAFSEWIQRGYADLDSGHSASSVFFSWRFWAGGAKKGNLVCGIVRDSSDSMGRPYPLLIMGTGALKGWEANWDRLPDVCGGVWGQMEYLSAKRFMDFSGFESEIRRIKPPVPPQWVKNAADAQWKGPAPDEQEVSKAVTRLIRDKGVFLLLDSGTLGGSQDMAAAWHVMLKERISIVPSTVFMGGSSEAVFLAVFNRPLAPSDFVSLWSGGMAPAARDMEGIFSGHGLNF